MWNFSAVPFAVQQPGFQCMAVQLFSNARKPDAKFIIYQLSTTATTTRVVTCFRVGHHVQQLAVQLRQCGDVCEAVSAPPHAHQHPPQCHGAVPRLPTRQLQALPPEL